jgi:CheY-like chemotaxis protein
MKRPPRILFVEDSEEDVELCQIALQRAGLDCDILVAEDERELRDAFSAFDPDLIVCDFRLPTIDGWEALSISRAVRPDVPFLFSSGTIGRERGREALERGADGCVEKGNEREFVDLVRQFVGA